MGIIGEAIDDIFNKIQDFVSFFIIYSLILIVAGTYYGVYFQEKMAFDYPLWILFIAIALYVLKELLKPKKK
jgi:hypothetical protein